MRQARRKEGSITGNYELIVIETIDNVRGMVCGAGG